MTCGECLGQEPVPQSGRTHPALDQDFLRKHETVRRHTTDGCSWGQLHNPENAVHFLEVPESVGHVPGTGGRFHRSTHRAA